MLKCILTLLLIFNSIWVAAFDISYQELKVACTNPEDFGMISSPQNIMVECSSQHSKWMLTDSSEIDLPTKLSVDAEVLESVYHSEKETYTSVLCPIYSQIIAEINLVRLVNCDDILNYSSLEMFCKDISDEYLKQNTVTYLQTGHKINLCKYSKEAQDGKS